MSDRKAELERKKARLEQMRKERQEKEQRRKLKEVDETKGGKQPQDLRAETEALLQDLGISSVGRSLSPEDAGSGSFSPGVHEGEPAKIVHSPGVRLRSKLSVSKLQETTIPPRENVMYSKETQTTALESSDKEDDDDSLEATVETPPPHSHKMPHVELVQPAKTDEEIAQAKKEEEQKATRKELSEEERDQIIQSEDFQSFFNRSSRIMERAIGESMDIFIDYSGGDSEGKDDDQLAGERLKLSRDFYDERWSKHRAVTSLDWSTQHPELLVASYNLNEESPRDPDGVALVWNFKFKKNSPEYIFHCQSSLMCCCFANFHPNLVLGGTYSGQVVLWDNRVNKRTPIQRTPLSAAAHTHPVYCVKVVGTQNAHNLITVSTDGKICSWSLDMLSCPQDNMELQSKQGKPVAVTCMSFLAGDVNNFVVGSEDCTVFTASRHGSKAGIIESFEGHQGPVTGIDCHAVPGQIDFSPYFLTSSFDWTIKLWSNRDLKYIHSFEDNSDYVYDVEWSPIHPALFASVDGMGRLDLWHLNNETEVPSATVCADGNVALNRCRWHQNGHSIAAGDDLGRIHVYDVGEHIANPKTDEWSKFHHTLQELKTHAAEREDDSTFAGSVAMQPLR